MRKGWKIIEQLAECNNNNTDSFGSNMWDILLESCVDRSIGEIHFCFVDPKSDVLNN